MIEFLLFIILNTLFVLLAAPLFMTIVKIAKAYAQGRRGPPLFQMYYNLSKLLKKEVVYSKNASFIMRLTPYLNMAFILSASAFIPFLYIFPAGFGIGNIFFFLYLLVASKFFMALAGLDAGSTFGGMGSSREMTISAVIEPVVIVVFATLAFVFKSMDLSDMFFLALQTNFFMNPAILLISLSLFMILIVETARVPVDNPETHLELTMVHEAMILEASGPNLALMEYSHAVKQMLFMGLLINVLAPWGLAVTAAPVGIIIAAFAFLAKACFLAVVVGLFESAVAKIRFFRLPALFMQAFFFAFITVLFELLSSI